ncbi:MULTISPECIES: TetR/AcrR family transcriptional regulator [unclassified Streptomyces]|uniref:TetR/AcrR family transcriptional regulator n=1 Tax=unclassified Streptomyces TaxID=2593676 RepID=UPI0038192FD0
MAHDGSESDPAAARRAPAGAAVLREDKTAAIRAAVFEELAANGFARMSIEGIARRAGVGKTAVYRRWRSKLHLVLDVVSAVAAAGLPSPDTGSLRGDVRMLLEVAARALRHPMASQIIPDLLAEAARSPELAGALRAALHDSQEGIATEMVARAVARGEIPAGVDGRLALDLLTGPLYWRLVVVRGELPGGYLDDLAKAVAGALGER